MVRAIFGKCPQCRRSFSILISDQVLSKRPRPSEVALLKDSFNYNLIDYRIHYYLQETTRGAILKEVDCDHYMVLIFDEDWKVIRFYAVNVEAFIAYYSEALGARIEKRDVEEMLDCLVLVDFDKSLSPQTTQIIGH
jgi:hypothetical protein